MAGDSLLSKLGLAILGQALPSASALEGYFAQARQALIYSILAAILIGATILVGLYGFYLLLIIEGLSSSVAIGVTLAATLLLALLCLQRATLKAKQSAQVTSSLSLFGGQSNASLPQDIAISFVEGLLKETDMSDKEPSHEKKIILVKD